jgi:acetoin utilization deacetylase AcuC-like enzyme
VSRPGPGDGVDPSLVRTLRLLERLHESRLTAALRAAGCAAGILRSDLAAPGLAVDTPIVPGAWRQALAAAHCALQAAELAGHGDGPAYAVLRPPGHHAGPDFLGGYCLLNNAVVAATALQDAGWRDVLVLDLDHHLGNGTLAFVDRCPGLAYASVHTSRPGDFPHAAPQLPGLVGFAQPPTDAAFLAAVDDLVDGTDDTALVVSVGFDTSAGDPHGCWSVGVDVWRSIGRRLRARSAPTVLVQEGGYSPEANHACARALAEGMS